MTTFTTDGKMSSTNSFGDGRPQRQVNAALKFNVPLVQTANPAGAPRAQVQEYRQRTNKPNPNLTKLLPVKTPRSLFKPIVTSDGNQKLVIRNGIRIEATPQGLRENILPATIRPLSEKQERLLRGTRN